MMAIELMKNLREKVKAGQTSSVTYEELAGHNMPGLIGIIEGLEKVLKTQMHPDVVDQMMNELYIEAMRKAQTDGIEV